EDGPNPGPLTGGFGLRAYGGINKPSYYAFQLLHELGHERLANPSHSAIVTRTRKGSLVIALWNLVDPGVKGGPKTMRLEVSAVPPNAAVALQCVDHNHGNVLPVYRAMGSPRYPTRKQVAEMNTATALPAPRILHLRAGVLALTLQPDALVLLRINAARGRT
ncbi:glycoside hydrolase family 39, partial [mine drainage metagenome]